jgi:hypothetical protein
VHLKLLLIEPYKDACNSIQNSFVLLFGAKEEKGSEFIEMEDEQPKAFSVTRGESRCLWIC